MRDYTANKILRSTILISFFIHALVLTGLSFRNFQMVKRRPKNIDIEYFNIKIEPKKAMIRKERSERMKEKIGRNTEIILGQNQAQGSLMKEEMIKSFKPFEIPKKQPVEVSQANIKKKVNVPPLKIEKINNPTYMSYYEIVRNQIKNHAYQNYEKSDTGEVYLTFILTSGGELKGVQLIEEKSPATSYLRDISLKSVQQSTPFPAFPAELKYPELTFNVVISFEFEE